MAKKQQRKKKERKERRLYEKLKNSHDSTISWLVKRLEAGGRYSSIEKNVNYTEGEFTGEVDVLAYNKESDTYHFYEIKSVYKRKFYNQATDQYQRYCEAYPDRKVKGIFVNLRHISRLR